MQRFLPPLIFASLFAGCSASSAPVASAPPQNRLPAEGTYEAAASLYRQAMRTNDHAEYRAAASAFERFLATHAKGPDVHDANEFDAESHYALQDWTSAAIHFQRAIAIDEHAKDTEEMAYANVLATRYAVGLGDSDRDPKCADPAENTPIPRLSEALPTEATTILAAYDLYLRVASEDQKTRAMILYSKARILQSCAHFEEAEPIFTDLVDHFSDSPEAPASAALLLDCQLQRNEMDALRARVKALETSPLGSDPLLTDMLRNVRRDLRRL